LGHCLEPNEGFTPSSTACFFASQWLRTLDLALGCSISISFPTWWPHYRQTPDAGAGTQTHACQFCQGPSSRENVYQVGLVRDSCRFPMAFIVHSSFSLLRPQSAHCLLVRVRPDAQRGVPRNTSGTKRARVCCNTVAICQTHGIITFVLGSHSRLHPMCFHS
jgi:hypothetical protein